MNFIVKYKLYSLFVKDHFKTVKEVNRDLSHGEIMKILSQVK